jgi:hypothetical protein
MKESNGYKAIYGSEGFSRSADKFAKNQHTGHSNDGREVNFGRGPTGGSTKVPAGKEITMGCHQPQVRNAGGTKEMPKTGKESFNYGRGPTKGNA